jgi:hypothetical protein
MNGVLVAVVFIAVASIVQSWILQASFKIVAKDTPTFGNAFKTCFTVQVLSTAAIVGLSILLIGPEGEGKWAIDALRPLTMFVLFSLFISMFIGTTLSKSVTIAFVLTVIDALLSVLLTVTVDNLVAT